MDYSTLTLVQSRVMHAPSGKSLPVRLQPQALKAGIHRSLQGLPVFCIVDKRVKHVELLGKRLQQSNQLSPQDGQMRLVVGLIWVHLHVAHQEAALQVGPIRRE